MVANFEAVWWWDKLKKISPLFDCEIHRCYMRISCFCVHIVGMELLSKEIGVSIDSIKNWHCGRKLPSGNNVEKLVLYYFKLHFESNTL